MADTLGHRASFVSLLLLAALAAIDLFLFLASVGTPGPARVSAIWLYGLLFGQFSLCAIWSALGSSHVLLRVVGAAAVTAIMAVVLTRLHNTGWLWLALLLLQLTIIVGPLLAIRWKWGLQLDHAPEMAGQAGQPPVPDRSRVRPVQFSLGHLMLAITVIAVITGVLRLAGLLAPQTVQAARPGVFWQIPWIGACFATVGLAAVWAGLGTGRLILRLFVALLITTTASLALWWSFQGPDRILGVITAIQGFELALALATLRIAGFRLIRISPNDECRMTND